MAQRARFVVVGGDAAGMSAASRAKRRRPELEVEVFEMTHTVSYGACGIPYFVGGLISELDALVVRRAEEFEAKQDIRVHLGQRVEEIRVKDRVVLSRDLSGGQTRETGFDHLLIATGAEPIFPPGLDPSLPGVLAVRNLEDAAAIRALISQGGQARRALVVGAGYIGVEMAENLAAAGLEVTMMVRGPRPMSTWTETTSRMVAEEVARNGVELLTGVTVQEAGPRPSGGLALRLSSGRELLVDLVVVGVGVRPRSQLAGQAGLELGTRGAIRVDRRQRTSDPNVFAAGDCAEAFHRLLGRNTYLPLALHANRQGRVVGDNVAGLEAEFPGVLGSAVTKIFDLTAARTGLTEREAREAGFEPALVEVVHHSRAGYYPGGSTIRTVVLADQGSGRPLGVEMLGRDGVAQRINVWAAALAAGLDLKQIADLDLAYAPPFSPVWDAVLVSAEVALKKIG